MGRIQVGPSALPRNPPNHPRECIALGDTELRPAFEGGALAGSAHIAQVDPKTLRVMRATERILLPENGATLGNSGVCRISERESWVTCGEGLLRLGKRKGQTNKVLVARITAGP